MHQVRHVISVVLLVGIAFVFQWSNVFPNDPVPSEFRRIAVLWRTQRRSQALDALAVYAKHNKDAALGCFSLARRAGRYASIALQQGERPFAVLADGTLCRGGYFRGFIEVLGQRKDTSAIVGQFCAAVREQLPPKTWDQCAFSIGIALADQQDIEKEGERRIVYSKTERCRNFFDDVTAATECVQGTIEAVGQYYLANMARVRNDDPLWLCNGLDWQFRIPCYRSLVSVLYTLTNGDFHRGYAFLRRILGENEGFAAMRAFASTVAFRSVPPSLMHTTCSQLQGSERTACRIGYASGLQEAAAPPREYQAATDFCLMLPHLSDYQVQCLTFVFADYEFLYPRKGRGVCIASVPISLRRSCPKE